MGIFTRIAKIGARRIKTSFTPLIRTTTSLGQGLGRTTKAFAGGIGSGGRIAGKTLVGTAIVAVPTVGAGAIYSYVREQLATTPEQREKEKDIEIYGEETEALADRLKVVGAGVGDDPQFVVVSREGGIPDETRADKKEGIGILPLVLLGGGIIILVTRKKKKKG